MIVSIDIGTSYSSISMLDPEGKAQSVDIGTGVSMFGSKFSLPSAVYVESNGEMMIGQAAMNSRMRNPQNFRDEFKRNLGENIPILLGGRSFLPENLYTEFFRHMKNCAEKIGGESIELAYLTHPASYGTTKKDKIVAAAKAAGLFNVELVEEPTAAAMCYCAGGYVKDGQNLLIYDFGGGTFDVSLIRFENGEFRQLTEPKGLERCGGIDIDRMVYQNMLGKVPQEALDMLQGNRLYHMRFAGQLSELAVKCKHHLSTADVFADSIMVGFDSVDYSLTVEDFNRMIAPLVGQTIQTCRQVLEDAGLKLSDLSAVLLVGGTSRVRLVREMVEKMAGDVPVHCAADLELAVSQGALNYRNFSKGADPEELYQMGWALEEEGKYEASFDCYLKAAELGHMKAQYEAALCYDIGIGVEEDKAEAVRWYQESADQGYADAQHALAECYDTGEGVIEDKKKAFYWYTKAAEQGYLDAQYSLGCCYVHGEGIKKDMKQAMLWFRKAAEQGHANAQHLVAVGYKNGEGIEQDAKQAAFWYEKAAEQGIAKAQNQIGWAYDFGEGVPVDKKKAVQWYTKAAEQGYADAQFNLAWKYEKGEGVSKDEKMAAHWFEQAAEQGHAEAQNNIGYRYENGIGVPQDEKKAFCWYTKAAEQGQMNAQNNLAICYDNGKGIPTDKNKATYWYQKAAEQGHAGAQYSLAWNYEHGEGVAKNLRLAVHWYEKAAKQGYGDAQNAVGSCYYNGTGVSVDYKRAFSLFTDAAKQGNRIAQYNLGLCYQYGRGVAKNINEAKRWYRKAADQGYEKAIDKLHSL